MDGSDVGNGIRVGVFREKEVFDAIQGTIFKEGIEIGCEANKCNFSDTACREFRGVVLTASKKCWFSSRPLLRRGVPGVPGVRVAVGCPLNSV